MATSIEEEDSAGYIAVVKLVTASVVPEEAAMIDIGSSASLLNGHSILHGGDEWRYSFTPLCKQLIKNEDGVSLAPFPQFVQDKVFVESWYHLNDAVLEGGNPFERAHCKQAFEYSATDFRFNKVFNQVMHDQSTIFMKKILKIYKGFKGVETLVYAGGGRGASLKMILSKHPSIKAINFDLPHVLNDALTIPGVEHVGGGAPRYVHNDLNLIQVEKKG